jgi:hypothetical protein
MTRIWERIKMTRPREVSDKRTGYEPELGQMCMGQPTQRLECPDYVTAALEYLANFFYDKVLSSNNPFRNTGARWSNLVFEVSSYDWNEDNIQPFNLKYKDIKVSWYKYLGRGMSINREVSERECWEMLRECVESIL